MRERQKPIITSDDHLYTGSMGSFTRGDIKFKKFGLFGKINRRQENKKIEEIKNNIPELVNVPVNQIEIATLGDGILGVGLLLPRVEIDEILIVPEISDRVATSSDLPKSEIRPVESYIPGFKYFFLEFTNDGIYGLEDLMKIFIVVETMIPSTLKVVKDMLGRNVNFIKTLDVNVYENDKFTHPKYTNENGILLEFRYSEIRKLKQKTPGRLDDVLPNAPDFDSTPDGIITRIGPAKGIPYTDFSVNGSVIGATGGVNDVYAFSDTSPTTPWQTAPTSWLWNFGPDATPQTSVLSTENVQYSTTGVFDVTLTTSNDSGSKVLTKNGFINII